VNIIGRVNVIASATLAYAGHDDRMMSPAIVTTAIHTTSPATTARSAFPIPLRKAGSLGEVVATRLGKIGHTDRRSRISEWLPRNEPRC
jgi:hypothetical protein